MALTRNKQYPTPAIYIRTIQSGQVMSVWLIPRVKKLPDFGTGIKAKHFHLNMSCRLSDTTKIRKKNELASTLNDGVLLCQNYI